MSSVIIPRFTIKQVTWQGAQQELSFIRTTVFIQEQNVPAALEWDGMDAHAIHILVSDEGHAPIATARMLSDGHIGRMAVLKAWRQQGVGRAILFKLLEIAQLQALPQVDLDAQTHAIAFYEAYGFVVCSDVFMDAGIPHKKMKRRFQKEDR